MVALDHLKKNYANLELTNSEYLEKIAALQDLVNKNFDANLEDDSSDDNSTQSEEDDSVVWFVVDKFLKFYTRGLLNGKQFKSFLIDKGLYYIFGKSMRKSILSFGQIFSIDPNKIAKSIDMSDIIQTIGSGTGSVLKTVSGAAIGTTNYLAQTYKNNEHVVGQIKDKSIEYLNVAGDAIVDNSQKLYELLKGYVI